MELDMRSDMAQVITDEPRRGGRIKSPKGEKRDWNRIPDDEKPYKERGNVRRKWIESYSNKEFGEHLGPLRRFALSCEGRNWDDVYSEICKCIDKGNVTQKHIFTHLYQYIERKVIIKNGIPYLGEYPFTPINSRYNTVVYVDPETKIIKRAAEYRRKKKVSFDYTPIETGWLDKNTFYMVKDSIWYACWLKEVPPPREVDWEKEYLRVLGWKRKVYDYVDDQFLGMRIQANDSLLFATYHRRGFYCYKKLQLNKREIRRIKKAYGKI